MLTVATGEVVWEGSTGGKVTAAGITLDAGGVAWTTNNHGLTRTTPDGNSTACTTPCDGCAGWNALGAATVATDGVILQLNVHGELAALA